MQPKLVYTVNIALRSTYQRTKVVSTRRLVLFSFFFLILQTLVDFEDHLLEIELTLRYYVFVILRRHRMSIIVIIGCSFYVADCELNQWWKVHKMHR